MIVVMAMVKSYHYIDRDDDDDSDDDDSDGEDDDSGCDLISLTNQTS